MNFFQGLFNRKKHPNPAINVLYRKQKSPDPKAEEIIVLLPKLAETYKEGGVYLLHKTLLNQFEEYDAQYGVTLTKEMTEEKSVQMLGKITNVMLMTCFKVLSDVFPGGPYPSALTDALHYDIYGALPDKDSFVDYLTYKNPNFEDSQMAPAFKFGADISEIVAMSDLSFSFLVAQQVAVISDVSERLIRWILFDEPLSPS